MNELALEYRKDFRDYFQAVRRRRLPLGATAVLVFAISAVVALVWPLTYRSTATILIEEQEIPQDLVRTTITSYADQRIQVISQQVMTRANLMQIVDKYDLYHEERKSETTEEILERMRHDIKLDLVNTDVTDRRSGGRTSATIAFTLSYDSRSPDKAQKVANELTTLYLNQNLEIRKEKADETTAFLAKEADQLNDRLSDIEAKLSDFKRKNEGRLPELSQINLSMRERADSEMMDTDRELSAIDDKRFYLQSQLATIKPNTPILSSTGERILDPEDRLKTLRAQYAGMEGVYSLDHPDMKRMRAQIQALESDAGTPADGNEEAKQLVRMKTELATLRNRYGEDHPDVVKLKAGIAALEAATAAHPAAAAAAAPSPSDKARKPENPAYLALQAQLEALDADAKSLKRHREELRARISMLDSRLEKTPEVERDYLEINRDRENTVVRYREVKAKLMEAQVAQELEQARKSERFSLIDPAQFPEKARSPNRPAILLIGALLALGGGIGSVGIMEVLDSSVRNSRDLARLVEVPLLSAIPYIANAEDRRRAKFPWRAALAGAVAFIAALLAAIHFLWMPLGVFWYSLLRHLP
jgi:uncharacterized protein involved in exopolysaccharide biosynthesis